MSTVIKGIVQAVESKTVSGGRVAWDIVVGGERYGAGLFKPKAKEGDYVEFVLDDGRGYKNVERNTLKVKPFKEAPEEALQEAKNTAPVRGGDGSVRTKSDIDREKRDEAKQETISRQSALNSAIAYLSVAQAADALGLPASGSKGKKLEALDTLLAKYTQMFYEQSTTQKWKGSTVVASRVEESEGTANEAESLPDDGPWQ